MKTLFGIVAATLLLGLLPTVAMADPWDNFIKIGRMGTEDLDCIESKTEQGLNQFCQVKDYKIAIEGTAALYPADAKEPMASKMIGGVAGSTLVFIEGWGDTDYPVVDIVLTNPKCKIVKNKSNTLSVKCF
jgi:hypothetical protein